MSNSPSYVGRFAPSPTGPLHFGSLLAAVASFLDARSQQGQWLMRMEDLDPAREPPGAADLILNQLLDFGLHWDGKVLYQSTRMSAYHDALARLQSMDLCYACDCSRPQIHAMGAIYDGRCRLRSNPSLTDVAVRLKTTDCEISFVDQIQGPQCQRLLFDTGDFVIRRRDGLIAYQLAVVLDDAWQHVTHIVRGYDLLDSTARQIYLQQLLGLATPIYAHLPIVVNAEGHKLSKQTFAEALKSSQKSVLLHKVLGFLGLNPPASLARTAVATQLEWAAECWHIQAVPNLATISEHAAG